MHCLGTFTKLTKDHGPPQAWYPDGQPEAGERPWAPACAECNARLSRVEKRLTEVFGLGLDPDDPATHTVATAAKRAIDPFSAYDSGKRRSPRRVARDFEARLRARQKTLESIFQTETADHVLPIAGVDRTRTGQFALEVDTDDLRQLGRKMVRVAAWWFLGELLATEAFVIRVFEGVSPDDVVGMRARDYDSAVVETLAPGTQVAYVRADTDSRVVQWEFTFWGKYTVSAFVVPLEIATWLGFA